LYQRIKKKIIFIDDLKITKEISVKYTPTTCTLSADDKLLAVGSGRDGENCVYVYDVETQKELFVIKNPQYIRNDVVCLSMTPNCDYLATADKDRAIWIWDIKNKSFDKPCNFNKGMKFHNGLITSIQFGGVGGTQLLTCGNDSNIYLFTKPTEGKSDNIHLDHAFTGLIRKCMFLTETRIVAIGGDSSIRFFNIQNK